MLTLRGMTFYDLRGKHGLLRDIVIRNSDTGEWMVLVQFHYDEEGDDVRAKALLQHSGRHIPGNHGVALWLTIRR